MSYILDSLSADPQTAQNQFAAYHQYLEKMRDAFPKNAYDFATAGWHYDFQDSRCPHDAWLESLTIREPAKGERREVRQIDITIHLLGAFQDGFIEMFYPNVSEYFVNTPANDLVGNHGDWLIDEVRLSQKDQVVHEILFSRGAIVRITSTDIIYRWKQK